MIARRARLQRRHPLQIFPISVGSLFSANHDDGVSVFATGNTTNDVFNVADANPAHGGLTGGLPAEREL